MAPKPLRIHNVIILGAIGRPKGYFSDLFTWLLIYFLKNNWFSAKCQQLFNVKDWIVMAPNFLDNQVVFHCLLR